MISYKYLMDFLAWESLTVGELQAESYDIKSAEDLRVPISREPTYPPRQKPRVPAPAPLKIGVINTNSNNEDPFEEAYKRIGPIKNIYLSSYFKKPKDYYDFVNAILWTVEKLYIKSKSDIAKLSLKREYWSDVSNNRLTVTYDSGGFQHLANRMKSKEKQTTLNYYNPRKCIEIYDTLGYENQDLLMQVDYPIIPIDSQPTINNLYEKNIDSLKYMQKKSINVVPVIHGWTNKAVNKHIEKVNNIAINNSQIAIGSFAALSSNSWRSKLKQAGYETKKIWQKIFKRIIFLVQKNYEKDIFLLGAGNIQLMHILFSHGIRWVDGASWRMDAQFYRVYIFQDTPIGVSTKRPVARKKRKSDKACLSKLINGDYDNKEEKLFYPLKAFADDYNELIDILQNGKVINKKTGERASSFTARAIHNAFIARLEANLANKILDSNGGNNYEKYRKYLRERFEKSHYWKKRIQFFEEQWKKMVEKGDIDFEFKKIQRIERQKKEEKKSKRTQKSVDMFFNTY
ncbi:MAG: hypothetical protein GF317_09955 [Candidatus Lokiarchaeota archaeon]|nr:hypothetical protein [Candidatus Lokiarchaeota archaeon]